MSTKAKFIILLLMFSSVAAAAFIFLSVTDIAVLQPKGMVGEKERDLLWLATGLMLIVVLPVFFLTFAIGWKYRAEANAEHKSEWDHSFLAECVWWGIPCLIILILGFFTWRGCHELDPFRPIENKKEMTIQVVALQWKWLFIYPKENIATINYIRFPKDTSIHFEITSDAPMNSFWIPELGGQIYAMAGMRSELYLIANETGQYRGSSANISGKGFAGMVFTAESSSEESYNKWVEMVQSSPAALTSERYSKLVLPSEFNPTAFFSLQEVGLFDKIMMKYMNQQP